MKFLEKLKLGNGDVIHHMPLSDWDRSHCPLATRTPELGCFISGPRWGERRRPRESLECAAGGRRRRLARNRRRLYRCSGWLALADGRSSGEMRSIGIQRVRYDISKTFLLHLFHSNPIATSWGQCRLRWFSRPHSLNHRGPYHSISSSSTQPSSSEPTRSLVRRFLCSNLFPGTDNDPCGRLAKWKIRSTLAAAYYEQWRRF